MRLSYEEARAAVLGVIQRAGKPIGLWAYGASAHISSGSIQFSQAPAAGTTQTFINFISPPVYGAAPPAVNLVQDIFFGTLSFSFTFTTPSVATASFVVQVQSLSINDAQPATPPTVYGGRVFYNLASSVAVTGPTVVNYDPNNELLLMGIQVTMGNFVGNTGNLVVSIAWDFSGYHFAGLA